MSNSGPNLSPFNYSGIQYSKTNLEATNRQELHWLRGCEVASTATQSRLGRPGYSDSRDPLSTALSWGCQGAIRRQIPAAFLRSSSGRCSKRAASERAKPGRARSRRSTPCCVSSTTMYRRSSSRLVRAIRPDRSRASSSDVIPGPLRRAQRAISV